MDTEALARDKGAAAQEPEDPKASSRREFLRKAGAGIALLAAGGAVATATSAGVNVLTKTVSAAEADEKRRDFLAQARTALQESHPLVGPSVEELPESTLAELADPTGQRSSKLLGVTVEPVVPRGSSVTQAVAPQIDNALVRMQQDIGRALKKPIEQRRWVMAIDLRKCIGCSACTVACKAENKLPPGVVYRPVIEQEIGQYPRVSRRFTPRPCMQCDDPPCVPVCPVGATYKRPDGIVEINYNTCIGCRYCIAACPYGARYFDFGENYTDKTPQKEPYEKEPSLEYGQRWQRENGASPIGNVRKCQFCLHRLAEGMLPACTTTCVGAATFFGDSNDTESLVSELINRPNVMRLKEELGTDPKVYYLV